MIASNNAALSLHFAPLLPVSLLAALTVAALLMLVLSTLFYRRGLFWRTLCAAAFLLVLAGPSLVEEDRRPVADVAAIIIDDSPSQQNGERSMRTQAAAVYLEQALQRFPGLEVRTIRAPADNAATTNETRLFAALDRLMNDVPPTRRAGAILITDGQVHDVPGTADSLTRYGPVHALLTGEKDERDRQLVVLESPAYGIVGETVTIRYRIEDSGALNEEYATVVSRINDEERRLDLVPVGEEQSITVTITHAGQNIVDLQASPVDGELTMANNRAPLIINGVRDRLRVLLVSGQPHAGGRTWRNLLTADPGVDLVHFTILREPNKLDATPQNELSLIAFPFRELFEVKLYDFDLIIFDRYRLNRILPNFYFTNIANYVKEGGALLEASGPAYASPDSIYTTGLKDVLPAYPTGQVFEESFRPAITDTGHRHPVTQDLSWRSYADGSEGWGPWLRQIAVQPIAGRILMTGVRDNPLLILNRVGEGRIAQLASDQIWLWSRGFEGGGPQAELLRRLAHWLMKEPELEETALEARVDGDAILIRRRTLDDTPLTASLTRPDGTEEAVELRPTSDGYLQARVEGGDIGIYSIDDGTQKRFAIIGELNPPELRGVITTEDRLAPVLEAAGGTAIWLAETPEPDLRMGAPGRAMGGERWLGLRKNNSYSVTGVRSHPLFPPWFYALGLIALLIAAWWFEGRTRKTIQN